MSGPSPRVFLGICPSPSKAHGPREFRVEPGRRHCPTCGRALRARWGASLSSGDQYRQFAPAAPDPSA